MANQNGGSAWCKVGAGTTARCRERGQLISKMGVCFYHIYNPVLKQYPNGGASPCPGCKGTVANLEANDDR